jgi:L-gulono-1,4-lactone dehydrogenase
MAAPDTDGQQGEQRTLTNFGGNQTWAALCYRPRDEADVLAILARHATGRVRVLGAGHSWSDVAVSSNVTVDMSGLNDVTTIMKGGETLARVGAGCRLYDVLARLHAMSDRTLPTLGAITLQTVAGAVATGTHGSGRESLSHFVDGARIAAYDASGAPAIFDYEAGDELKAARCALGCMGIVLRLDLRTVPKYQVEETARRHETLDQVLARIPDQPLTQFILVPYRWDYVAWERRPDEPRVPASGERLKAQAFRVSNTVNVDIVFHFFLKASLLLGPTAVKALLKLVPHLLITNIARRDDAEHVLTLGHHYYRHEEMELFVPESRLREAVEVLRCATEIFAGDTAEASEAVAATLTLHNLYGELIRHMGTYVQQYPFFFRRILPEDTLLSMASGVTEPMYSISVFTYLRPDARAPYYAFCLWLARCMVRLFGARLHWGKHFPLSEADIASAYPGLAKFKELCRRTDPHGVFRNDYSRRVLGL